MEIAEHMLDHSGRPGVQPQQEGREQTPGCWVRMGLPGRGGGQTQHEGLGSISCGKGQAWT